VEVIPDKLAVISLNTMYFYDSNKGTMSPLFPSRMFWLNLRTNIAVEGCEYNDPDDPGNLEFDWLEVQLEYFRDRHMQVRRRRQSKHDRQLIVYINTRG
jgi:endopolyphosphatase